MTIKIEQLQRRLAVFVRTHVSDSKTSHLLSVLSKGAHYDLFVCANETSGRLDFSPYEKVSHTFEDLNHQGFRTESEYDLQRLSDQIFYQTRLRCPNYGFYLFIENDVHLSREDPDFIDQVAQLLTSGAFGDVDFVGTHNRSVDDHWHWYAECRRIFPEVYATFFPFIGLSARALDYLHARRLQEHAEKPQDTPYVFCEAFVPTALKAEGSFRLEDIATMVPGCYDFATFNLFTPQIMEEARGGHENVQMMHPVYTAEVFLTRQWMRARAERKLHEFGKALRNEWPSVSDNLRLEFMKRILAAEPEHKVSFKSGIGMKSGIAGRWLLCNGNRNNPISTLELLVDGQIRDNNAGLVTWSLANPNELMLLGPDRNAAYIFSLTVGRGAELHSSTPENFYLRPLGPAMPTQFGPLKVRTSSLSEARQLASQRIDFSFIASPPRDVYSPVQRLILDYCKIVNHQAFEFLVGSYKSDDLFFNILHDAELIHGHTVIRRDGVVMGESTSFILTKLADFDFALSANTADWSEAYIHRYEIDTSQSGSHFLFSTLRGNYAHWYMQSLCNVEAVSIAQDIVGEKIGLLSFFGWGSEESFRRPSMAHVGLDPSELISVPHDLSRPAERYDRLIVPNTVGLPTGCRFHPAVVNSFGKLKPPRSIHGKRRIFISRRDVTPRQITNSKDLFRRLQKLDFVEICPGEMSYSEELQIFADADVVVAPHGGALANMVAHPPGLKIFEIFHSNQLNGWFKNLSAICGHHYAAYCIDPPVAETGKGWQASFSVNIDRVISGIEQFINE